MRTVAMADHLEARATLPSDPASARAARTFVTDTLREWGLPDGAATLDSVRLIVSELATNVVRHARGLSPTFTVDLRLDCDEELRIGVTDSDPRPPRRLSAAPQRDSGRGLEIIRHLTAEAAGRMTVEPTAEGGKTIWVCLPWTERTSFVGRLLNRFANRADDRVRTEDRSRADRRPAGAQPSGGLAVG
jgi:anti-sigma regulatory factor (Ser/Thr protein kinase)